MLIPNYGMQMPDVRPPKEGWAPGTYSDHCCICESAYVGDKYSFNCSDCAWKVTEPEPTWESN